MTRAASLFAALAALLFPPAVALAGPMADLEAEVKGIVEAGSPSVVRVVVKTTLRLSISPDGTALPGTAGLGGRGRTGGASADDAATAGGAFRVATFPFRRIGSGFVIGAGDVVLTAGCLAEGAERATVEFGDRTSSEAEVVGVDPYFQVAVLRLAEPAAVKPLQLADAEPSPCAMGVLLSGTAPSRRIALGVVSAAGRPGPRDFDNYIEVDVAIRSADSGAPFLDAAGRVIGMAVAPPGGEHCCEAGGRLVPAADLRHGVAEILAHGRVRRGFLGIGLASRDIEVLDVNDGSPADRAGLVPGDRITAIAGRAIESSAEFAKRLRRVSVGEPVPIRVLRDGAEVDLTAVLDEVKPGHEPIFHGIGLRTIDGRVYVVSTGGRLARAGIRPGDEIRRVNGEDVVDATQILRSVLVPEGGELRIEVRRGTETISISVGATAEK